VTKIKKKQVIYYSGQAFSGANHRLELIGNNKGRIFDKHDFLIRGIDEESHIFYKRIDDKRKKRQPHPDYLNPLGQITGPSNEIISLTSKDISIFWEIMDKLEVYQWSKNYDDSNYCDGYGYEIKLRNPEGKAKYCSGHMKYPENILDFIDALNKLFKTNIKVYP